MRKTSGKVWENRLSIVWVNLAFMNNFIVRRANESIFAQFVHKSYSFLHWFFTQKISVFVSVIGMFSPQFTHPITTKTT